MSDSHIPTGKHMKKEPSDELIGLESQGLLFITIGIVPPAKGDIAILDFKNTVVADSNSMGISAQVLKDSLGTIKRRLAIDNPFLMVELSSEHFKGSWVFQMTDAAGEDKLTRFKTSFEIILELASEQCRHDPHRDKKPLPARYPAASVRRQSAAGYNTVDMRMIHKVLSPGMENADKPYACPEMLRIIGELHKRL